MSSVRFLVQYIDLIFLCLRSFDAIDRRHYRSILLQRQSMFQVRLLLCLTIFAYAQAKTQFIRGEIINPVSRNILSHNNDKTARKGRSPSSASGSGMNGKNSLQNILEFQSAKKFSGSQPSRKSR